MRIREYTSADFDALRRMHAAQGFGYPLPDLESPLLLAKLVLEEDPDDSRAEAGQQEGREEPHLNSPPDSYAASATSSRVVMAVLLRLTAETYLLHDPAAGTPRLRWQRFLALHEAARNSAAARGLDDVQAFLPPRVARAFGRRLARLGWARDPWPCFSRRV
jgi:hypothetical protein